MAQTAADRLHARMDAKPGEFPRRDGATIIQVSERQESGDYRVVFTGALSDWLLTAGDGLEGIEAALLNVGQVVTFGGGAAPMFEIRRI